MVRYQPGILSDWVESTAFELKEKLFEASQCEEGGHRLGWDVPRTEMRMATKEVVQIRLGTNRERPTLGYPRLVL